MGAYLPTPITATDPLDEKSENFTVGASAMQGWRLEQEDAHICKLNVTDKVSIFAVFDGHGGSEVSQYAAEHLIDFLHLENIQDLSIEEIKSNLRKDFLTFDEHLIKPKILSKLFDLSSNKIDQDSDADSNELEGLIEDSELSKEELLRRYGPAKDAFVVSGELKEGEGSGKEILTTSGTPRQQKRKGVPVESDEEKPTESSCKAPKLADSTDSDTTTVVVTPAKSAQGADAGAGEAKEPKASSGSSKSVAPTEKPGTSSDQANADACGNGDGDDSSEDIDYSTNMEEHVSSSEEEEVVDEYEASTDEDEEFSHEAEKLNNEALELMLGKSAAEKPGFDSGTTAVLGLVIEKDSGEEKGTYLIVANIGDSRCVISRSGVSTDMSEDHKPEDTEELKRITNAGGQVTEDGRVNGGLNLSRAFGDHTYKKTENLPLKDQMICAEPDVKSIKLEPNDEFMILACDGIWNSMSSQAVVDTCRSALKINPRPKLSSICDDLFNLCLADNTKGDGTGCDNMTAILVVFNKFIGDLKAVNTEGITNKTTSEVESEKTETNDKEVEQDSPEKPDIPSKLEEKESDTTGSNSATPNVNCNGHDHDDEN